MRGIKTEVKCHVGMKGKCAAVMHASRCVGLC